jgi:DNA adenine methylase
MSSLAKTSHGPSFLRWAGSKRKSLGHLAASIDLEGRRYIEPFAGSAALFFHFRPHSGVLADQNAHLINALRMVRDFPDHVYEGMQSIDRDSESYYRVRSAFNELAPDSVKSASYFLYLNRNCFNGLWRTNKKGQFNVPYGGTAMGRHPPIELIKECSDALKNAKIEHQDFRVTITQAGEGDFLFIDPPYFHATERTFIEYGTKSFGRSDLDDLIDISISLVKRGGKVALIYSGATILDQLPPEWHRSTIDVTRNVGGFSNSRRRQSEVMYMSDPTGRGNCG